MARRRDLLQFTVPPILNNFLLGLCCTLLVLFSQGFLVPVLAVNKQLQTEQLTQQGYTQLHQGQATAALQTWEAATKIYRELNNSEGLTNSLINQSLALQALGLDLRACQTLTQALKLEDGICTSSGEQAARDNFQQQVATLPQKQPKIPPKIQAIGLRNLGDIFRLIGKLDLSEIVLQKAIEIAKSFSLSENVHNQLLLNLANTEDALYNQAKNKYQLTDEPIGKQKALQTAQSKFNTALELYQQVSLTREKQNSTVLKAQLNQLSLVLELKQWLDSETEVNDASGIKELQSTSLPLLQLRAKQLSTAQFGELPAIESIYARLNFAQSLMKIAQNVELNHLLFSNEKNALDIALSLGEESKQLSQKLDNERAESYAFGTIGKIYGYLGQIPKSKQYLEKALSLALSVRAWDIAYQWQQQLGRVYQQTLNYDQAAEAYVGAINSLDQVQGSILSINPKLQFSFKDKVEPIYQEYIKLLLNQNPSNLKQVIQTNERLQLAELENFLQCGKLNLVALDDIQNTSLPTVIHVINVDNRIEVIVQSSQGVLHRHSPKLELVKRNVDNLLLNLQDERFVYTDEQSILSYSQALYNLLIAPIKTYLPRSGTLVFILDKSFQSLPMGLLHDGKDYLLKHYSISETLGSRVRQPKPLPKKHLKALIAGLSKNSPSFKSPNAPKNLKPLPSVEVEVADVKEQTNSTELLNEKFTSQRFRQEIGTNTFPIVHVTTHGQFSSEPEQTVILAWDKPINVREFHGLLTEKTQANLDGIELLVLSACQTAKGNKRSALGIAGVAAQAGARSTVATLWLVDAESTTQLMDSFYRGLKNGIPKAEALRQAQISLLSNPKWQHPYYWAPFLLVGSWF